ncbi:hypothetical protein AAVH_26479, partial [Aphelenchoides avenae]
LFNTIATDSNAIRIAAWYSILLTCLCKGVCNSILLTCMCRGVHNSIDCRSGIQMLCLSIIIPVAISIGVGFILHVAAVPHTRSYNEGFIL